MNGLFYSSAFHLISSEWTRSSIHADSDDLQWNYYVSNCVIKIKQSQIGTIILFIAKERGDENSIVPNEAMGFN